MKPWTLLAEARGPDGQPLTLHERDGTHVIRSGGQELMSSLRNGSEEAMAEVLRELDRTRDPTILIGGLGLGYTLRATLDLLPQRAQVIVAEISEPIVVWNRGPLSQLAGNPLDDSRVSVKIADVGQWLATTRLKFDAVLMDVDNGPTALSARSNAKLYDSEGIRSVAVSLRPGGVLVVWSADPDPAFLARLRSHGFCAEARATPARAGHKGAAHTLFVARKT